MDSSKATGQQTPSSQIKKTYLFLYNLLLFVVFSSVFVILSTKLLTTNSVDDDVIQRVATIVRLITYTQLLEVIHPIINLVPGGPMMPLLQVSGRLIVNLFISDPKIRMDAAPFVLYLFIVWSSIELFRYSFYALRVLNMDFYPITWCRYTLFIPLYPMGGFYESKVLQTTIKHYAQTGTYSVGLPNPANFSFHLPSVLNFYIFFLLGPGIYSLMKYMWRQRCKQLEVKKKEYLTSGYCATMPRTWSLVID